MLLQIMHMHTLELHPGLLELPWVTASTVPLNGGMT
jgi:hypothetical protein